MPSGPRILVILNPAAGSRRRGLLLDVLGRLAAAGARVDLRSTARRGDAEALARDAVAGAFDVVVAAGGDGTIGEVVNGLPDDAPPLALLPLGTANVFASEIGLKRRAREVARTILGGRRQAIHAGLANGRRFLVMAGAGLDAEVVAAVDPALKSRFGKLAYVLETMRQARRYGFPALTIEADGETFAAVTAVACKGRRYGGPYLFAPGADVTRPDFELVTFARGGTARIILYALALGLGLLAQLPGVRRRRVAAVRVSGPAGAPVQGDGDVIARLPVAVTIDRRPLAVLYPPERV